MLHVLCVGDSMTDREGGVKEYAGQNYPYRLWEFMDPNSYGFRQVEVMTDITGQEVVLKGAFYACDRIEGGHPPEAVIMQGGGDELDAGVSPERLLGQFDVVAKVAREQDKKFLFLLCPWQHKEGGAGVKAGLYRDWNKIWRRKRFNDLLIESYPDNTLDYFSVLWADRERYIADGPHPSEEGDKKMAEMVWEKLKSIK